MDWVATSGERPAVLSMSLGGSGADPGYTSVINVATGAGVTVVVAAGNSNADACNFSPAFSAKAITVGATTRSNTRASYSNFGTCVDIMAPGSDIVSASSGSDSGSKTLSGTSMACPHVSGGAALLLAANPSLKYNEILDSMLESSRKGLISGLMPDDPDEFLWVSDSPAPAPPPPAQCSLKSRGPDGDGDCKCDSGYECYEDGGRGCTYSYSSRNGRTSVRYHLAGCIACKCQRR